MNINGSNKQQIDHEMEDKAAQFLNRQKDVSTGRISDYELAQMTTQALWESEKLTIQKQQQMGLVLEVDMEPPMPPKKGLVQNQMNQSVFGNDQDGLVSSRQEGNVITGCSRRGVTAFRKVYQNGNEIHHSKSRCNATVNLLKSNVNGDQVACPNCGAYGDLSSFIDGCDYCHAKFKVEDFAAKVSGFSLIEDAAQRLEGFSQKMTKAYIAMFMIVFCFLFFGTLMDILFVNQSYESFQASFSINMFLFKALAAAFMVVFSSAIIRGFIVKPQGTFTNESVVTRVYPAFSRNDFMQNVEYRLKAAIMATSIKQVEAFCDCDMNTFMEYHKDVFDMNVAGIAFRDAQVVNQGQGCQVTADVSVRLFCLSGNRVKTKYEKITIAVYGDQSAILQNTASLRAYKCPNCNSNINIFNGGICEYCNTQINKYSLGWVIRGYQCMPEKNMYDRLPWLILAIFLFFLLNPFFL